MVDDDSDDWDDPDEAEDAEVYAPTQQEIEQVIQRGLKAAAKGENVDHLLAVMTSLFPAKSAEEIAKKFSRALAQKKLRQPVSEDRPARSKLVRINRMFTLIMEQQAAARVAGLMAKKPEVATRVNQQGQTLAAKGVIAGKERLTGADLGTLSPSSVGKPRRGKSSERDA